VAARTSIATAVAGARAPYVYRAVSETGNSDIWSVLGREYGPRRDGRARDPFMEQGCHPDMVVRVWHDLGDALPVDSRAQAKGKPVLAHPTSGRIIAAAYGTAYMLWLTPDDYSAALALGAKKSHVWAGGHVTDLRHAAGPGWIWGRWYQDESVWAQHAFDAAGDVQS
jgi:hypothetical protein